MDGGLRASWSRLQFHLAPDVTGSWSGTSGAGRYQLSASLDTKWVFNIVSLNDGLSMVYSSVKDPSVADWWRLDVDIPDLGIVGASYGAASWEPGQEAIVEFQDVKLWETVLGLWRVTVAAVVVYVAGSVVDTFVTSGYTLTSNGLGPSYVPIFGGWGHFTAEAQAGTVGASGNYTASSTVSGTVQGGWRYKVTPGGAWRADPVAIKTPIIPSCDSHCQLGCLSASGIITGTTTHNVTIAISQTVLATLDTSGIGLEIDGVATKGGEIAILPDLDKKVIRHEKDYAALIERGGMLKVTWTGSRYCYNGEPFGGPGDPFPGLDASVTGEVHSRLTDFLAFVGDSMHTIEDPLKWHSYSLYSVNNEQSYFKYEGGIATEQHTERVQFAVGDHVDDSTDNPQIWSYLDHAIDIVRYFQINCCPHWSYRYFPWEADIGGSSAPWDGYWANIRQQHSSQPSLPAGELRNTRTSMISAPLLEGGNVGFIDAYLGGGGKTSWWGNCGIKIDDVAPVSSKTLDSTSSAAWSSPDTSCTLAHAGSITVTSLGGATVKIRLNLGRFSEIAWLYTLIAKRIAVSVTATNVTSWTAKLTGLDGDQVLLATANGTYDFPLTGTASKYAGTWGQDFGAGYVSDTGSDFTGDGDSAAAMADPERLTAFEYLPSKNAAYLDFELALTNPALTATIAYPTFYAPTDNSTVVYETGLSAAILWPDGPLARWGQLSYWDYLLDVFADNPPAISGQNTCATILDWLCFKRQLLQGKAATDGLDAEWAAMFDSVEINARKDLAFETLAYILPKGNGIRAVLVNTYQPPPIAQFPIIDPLAPSRSLQYSQRVYVHGKEPRDYVSAPQALRVIDPGDSSEWTGASTFAVAGFEIRRHNHPTDGSEGAFDIYAGLDKIAESSPWHGYTASLLNKVDLEGEDVSYDVSINQRHYRAFLSGGTVWVGRADNAFTGGWNDYDTGIAADAVQIRCEKVRKGQRVFLYTEESGAIKERRSTDDALTFGMAITLISSASEPAPDTTVNGLRYVYGTSGTAVKGTILDAADNVVVSTFTVSGVTVDSGSRVAVHSSTKEGGTQRIIMLAKVGGAIVQYESLDGQTFT